MVKDLPVVVGGKLGLTSYSNSLYCYTSVGRDGRWTKIFTAMLTTRANPSVMVVGENLFMIGGENTQGPLAVVEVMNTETQQWHILVPLPEPLVNASILACGSQIYVLGGRDRMNKASKSVYTCSLEALVSNRPNVWQKLLIFCSLSRLVCPFMAKC